MSDADTQPPELIAHLRNDVAHAIVPSRPTTLLEPYHAGLEIQLVVGHQYRHGGHLVETCDAVHGTAAAVHEAHRLQQPQIGPVETHLREIALMTRLAAKCATKAARQFVHEKKAGVVPRACVFGPGIAETDDQLERHT